MTSNAKVKATKPAKKVGDGSIEVVTKKGSITEYYMPHNGLTILYAHRPKTGVITSDIVYAVGARDEARGETGIAHMLEHMLFKPTVQDIKRKSDSAAMQFERETGCVLNANTWKDRTSYFFSYPKEHFDRALRIEAERMRDVVLTDKEFLPERTNVLSEFDMNAGDEEFVISVQMMGLAFHSHPYGHETIGYREDIESYTVEKLDAFYKKFYAPNNATLIVVGDITEAEMLAGVTKHFTKIKPSHTLTPRENIDEPLQEGIRKVVVKKPSTTNMLSIGVKHEGFPSPEWFETMVAFDLLAGGEDSILHKKLVDTGLASSIHAGLEPSYDENLGIIHIKLTGKTTHDDMYMRVCTIIDALTVKDITPYLKKIIARVVTSEFSSRDSSLGFVSELVEYVSAGEWEHFFETEKTLRAITPKQIHEKIKSLFAEDHLTIGYFVGTKTK